MFLRPQLLLLAATVLAHVVTSPKRQDSASRELPPLTQSSSAAPRDGRIIRHEQTTNREPRPSTLDMTNQIDAVSRKDFLPWQGSRSHATRSASVRLKRDHEFSHIRAMPAGARYGSTAGKIERSPRSENLEKVERKYLKSSPLKTTQRKNENVKMTAINVGTRNQRGALTTNRQQGNLEIKMNDLDQGSDDAIHLSHTGEVAANKNKREIVALRQKTSFTRKPLGSRHSSNLPPLLERTRWPLRMIKENHHAAVETVGLHIMPTAQRIQRSPEGCSLHLQEHRNSESITQKNVMFQNGKSHCKPCKCHQNHFGALVADCSNLGLTDVPSVIPVNISQLLFSRNKLGRVHSNSFGRFTRLTLLDLSRNDISSFSSTAFKGLGCLQTLYLHRNKLLYCDHVFMEDLFSPLRSLRSLTLQGNTEDTVEGVRYPDQALSRLSSLEALSMDGLMKLALGPGFLELKSLKNLSFSDDGSFCGMNAVMNGTFVNVPNLRLLNISRCKLHFLDSASLSPLKQIDTVDISNNMFLGFCGMQNATHGLKTSQIRVFMANVLHQPFSSCIVIRRNHVAALAETAVQELHVDGNNIQFIESGVFPLLRNNTEKIYARGNQFLFGYYVMEFAAMRKITYANLQADNFRTLPEFPHFYLLDQDFRAQRSCQLPSAGCCELDVDYASEHTAQEYQALRRMRYGVLEKHGTFSFPIPKSLRELDLSHRSLEYNLYKTVFTKNNSLEILDLSFNLMKTWIGPVMELRKLKKVSLAGNYANVLQMQFFTYFESLEVLNISHNQLSRAIANDVEGAMFANLSTLLLLDISFNGIWNVSRSLFRGLRSLEVLIMAENRLPAEMMAFDLSHMSNLRLLDVSSNNLESIPHVMRDMLEELAKRSNFSLELNITNNPFSCSCNNRDFLQWLRLTPIHVVAREQLWCQFGNGAAGPMWKRVEELGQECVSALLTAAILGSVVVLLLMAGLAIYRYRWKLRYLYHMARGHYRGEERPLDQFQFDAFISCAEEDEAWVAGELLQQLETVHGLKLCLPPRDFKPGRPLPSSVVEAVVSSRRTVLVLSPAFLASSWCEFQVQMTTMEGVHTGRDVAMFLLYDHVCMPSLPREVLYHIHSDAYMEFPRDPRCRAFFWDNLALALRQP